jgi:hypothetical protein
MTSTFPDHLALTHDLSTLSPTVGLTIAPGPLHGRTNDRRHGRTNDRTHGQTHPSMAGLGLSPHLLLTVALTLLGLPTGEGGPGGRDLVGDPCPGPYCPDTPRHDDAYTQSLEKVREIRLATHYNQILTGLGLVNPPNISKEVLDNVDLSEVFQSQIQTGSGGRSDRSDSGGSSASRGSGGNGGGSKVDDDQEIEEQDTKQEIIYMYPKQGRQCCYTMGPRFTK